MEDTRQVAAVQRGSSFSSNLELRIHHYNVMVVAIGA